MLATNHPDLQNENFPSSSSQSSYYLEALKSLLTEVQKTKYSHLFSNEESALITQFFSLSKDAQRLWTRLWMRKKEQFFSLSHLQSSYRKEIPNLQDNLQECSHLGFLEEIQNEESILESLPLEQTRLIYTKMFPDLLHPKAKKEILISKLLTNAQTNFPKKRQSTLAFAKGTLSLTNAKRLTLLELIEKEFGRFFCIPAEIQSIFVRFVKLALSHFGPENVAELMEQCILVHLGRIYFPKVQEMSKSCLFVSRDQFLQYLCSRSELNEFYELFEKDYTKFLQVFKQRYGERMHIFNENSSFSSNNWKSKYTKKYVEMKIWFLYAQALQKNKQFTEAKQVYLNLLNSNVYFLKREDLWERLIVICQRHLKEPSKSILALCEKALAEIPSLPGYFLSDLKRRMAKLQKQPLPSSLSFPQVSIEISQFLYPESQRKRVIISTLKGASYTVENWALEQHYASGSWSGIHSEGSILSTVAILLLWNCIFPREHEDDETFHSPNQSFPLNFFTPCFWNAKALLIKESLTALDCERASFLLKQNYTLFHEITAIGVNWSIPMEACVAFVEALPFGTLSRLIEHLFSSYSKHLAGFPDLFLWRPKQEHQSEGLDYLLVEVKSTNDKLSSKQIYWIELFMQLGMNFELLKITRSSDSSIETER